MKLSAPTLEIIKNFGSISPDLIVRKTEGGQPTLLSVRHPVKMIQARAELAEEFPRDVPIKDVPKFVRAAEAMKDKAQIDLQETYLTLSNGAESKIKFVYAVPSTVKTPNKHRIAIPPERVVRLTLSEDNIAEIDSYARILGVPDLAFVNGEKPDTVEVRYFDRKNESQNVGSITLPGQTEGATFDIRFLMEDITLLPGNYDVALFLVESDKPQPDGSVRKVTNGAGCFLMKGRPIEYYVGVGTGSTYFKE